MASPTSPSYTLHTYFRSSCSARIRIVLNLKNIPYEPIYINLLKDEHKSDQNVAVNPSAFVPTLIQKPTSSTAAGQHQHVSPAVAEDLAKFTLTQSMAILEYLEEAHPDSTPLLPPKTDLRGRALVRALANIVACDIQPVTNMRILRRVTKIGGSNQDWARELIVDGLAAYETLVASTAGKFSYGDQITIADVCLVPAMWGAVRFGVQVELFPVLKGVFDRLSLEEGVKRAHWGRQYDCPEELRVVDE